MRPHVAIIVAAPVAANGVRQTPDFGLADRQLALPALLATALSLALATMTGESAAGPLKRSPLASSTAGLECALTASPATASVGQAIRVELSVSNAGLPVTRLWFATPFVESGPGISGFASVESGPTVRPVTLATGESATLAWTATARAAGTVRWTVSASGVSVTYGRTVSSGTLVSNETVIQTAPALSAVIRSRPADPCSGRSMTAVVEISNAGQASVTALAPSVVSASGPGGVVLPAVGSPLPPAFLAGGGTVEFSVTLTAGSPGIVVFSATLTGTDANSGAPVVVTASSAPFEILVPGQLSLATAARAAASRGQWVVVGLTVTNTGGHRITGLTPALTVSGAGAVIRRPSPDPGELEPGSARTFRWTYSVAGMGEYEFTATVSGLTCDSVPLSGTGWAVMEAVPPAALAGSLAVSRETVVSGQWVVVTLSVSDTGGAPARFVRPVGIESSVRAFRTGGPEPRAVEDLPRGGSAVFTWTYSMTGSGPAGTAVRDTRSSAIVVERGAATAPDCRPGSERPTASRG